jgi:hypothetical protein
VPWHLRERSDEFCGAIRHPIEPPREPGDARACPIESIHERFESACHLIDPVHETIASM